MDGKLREKLAQAGIDPDEAEKVLAPEAAIQEEREEEKPVKRAPTREEVRRAQRWDRKRRARAAQHRIEAPYALSAREMFARLSAERELSEEARHEDA
jgi:hypothetical protein